MSRARGYLYMASLSWYMSVELDIEEVNETTIVYIHCKHVSKGCSIFKTKYHHKNVKENNVSMLPDKSVVKTY